MLGGRALRQLALALSVVGCASHVPRWRADPLPTPVEAGILIESSRSVDYSTDALVVREIPDIPLRTKLRPCCAFGSDIGASIAGLIPIPGYRIPNVIGPSDVGPHTYDSGIVSMAVDGKVDPAFDREHNGLVYTCRGGFIDTAHVRDYADWAIFLVAQIARLARNGGRDRASRRGRPPPRDRPAASGGVGGAQRPAHRRGAARAVAGLRDVDLARDRDLVRLRLRSRASRNGRPPSRPRISTRTPSARS